MGRYENRLADTIQNNTDDSSSGSEETTVVYKHGTDNSAMGTGRYWQIGVGADTFRLFDEILEGPNNDVVGRIDDGDGHVMDRRYGLETFYPPFDYETDFESGVTWCTHQPERHSYTSPFLPQNSDYFKLRPTVRLVQGWGGGQRVEEENYAPTRLHHDTPHHDAYLGDGSPTGLATLAAVATLFGGNEGGTRSI